jgi:hypothetical protein
MSLAGRFGEAVQVAHLPPGSCFPLAVEVQFHPGNGQCPGPVGVPPQPQVAEKIDHAHRRQEPRSGERETAQGPDLLLELVHRAGIERVMAAVVWPGRELVGVEPPLVRNEQLDPQDPDIFQPRSDPFRHRGRLAQESLRKFRRHGGGFEDSMRVDVGSRRKGRHFAVLAARQHHGQLSFEPETALQHARHATEPGKRPAGFLP